MTDTAEYDDLPHKLVQGIHREEIGRANTLGGDTRRRIQPGKHCNGQGLESYPSGVTGVDTQAGFQFHGVSSSRRLILWFSQRPVSHVKRCKIVGARPMPSIKIPEFVSLFTYQETIGQIGIDLFASYHIAVTFAHN